MPSDHLTIPQPCLQYVFNKRMVKLGIRDMGKQKEKTKAQSKYSEIITVSTLLCVCVCVFHYIILADKALDR